MRGWLIKILLARDVLEKNNMGESSPLTLRKQGDLGIGICFYKFGCWSLDIRFAYYNLGIDFKKRNDRSTPFYEYIDLSN